MNFSELWNTKSTEIFYLIINQLGKRQKITTKMLNVEIFNEVYDMTLYWQLELTA